MNEENNVCKIIDRCLKRSKPPVKLYSKDSDGSYYEISSELVVDAKLATEELEHEISNYLRIKEAEINNRLTQVKCEAYELALTHTRPIERFIEDNQ